MSMLGVTSAADAMLQRIDRPNQFTVLAAWTEHSGTKALLT
jgi:hypothetical protein